jgi:hypothetical protein
MLRLVVRSRAVALVLTAALATGGCLGSTGDAPARASLALEWEADPVAVRLIGLFAFDAALQGLRCESYEAGEFDPFAEGEPAGISFFAVQELAEGEQLLDGVTTGNRLILVEAYDAGGQRIFLGCGGPVAIEANEKAAVRVTLVQDPTAGE